MDTVGIDGKFGQIHEAGDLFCRPGGKTAFISRILPCLSMPGIYIIYRRVKARLSPDSSTDKDSLVSHPLSAFLFPFLQTGIGLLPVSPGGHIAPAGSRRCRHDNDVCRMRADRVEAQRREKVRGVRQEKRIHEVLLRETLLHQRGLCEAGAGDLI
jgi:hypothetical protein